MSLEAALVANTAVLERVAELLEESNKAREAALAKMDDLPQAEAPPPATRRGRPRADARPAPAVEEATPAVEEKKPEPVEEKQPEHPSIDDLRAAAVAFNSVDNQAVKQDRKDFMRAVMDELGIGENAEGKRVITGALPEDRQKIIDWFAAVAAGEKVNFSSDEDDIG